MRKLTQIIHGSESRNRYAGAVNPPVFHASLFGYQTYAEFLEAQQDVNNRPVYSRHFNPTVAQLEQKIADLEQAETAIAFSSGMGAITAALLALLTEGDHLLVVETVYGPAREFCDSILTRMGVNVEYFSAPEAANLEPRLRSRTRLIYLESPGSLTFEFQDLQAVSELAQRRKILTMADNSWATPLYQNPLSLGIDIVVHSGSKYIAGHSDITLGLLACSSHLFDQIKPVAALLGANLAPGDAYLAMRGLRTLPLRMAQHQQSALAIARWLEKRPEVREVLHPALSTFPYHEIGRKQMSGYSSLFSFRLQPGTEKARHAFVDALELFLIGVSWGGYESLILPLTTAYQNEPAWRARRGLDDDTFRTSIGLEDTQDLLADLVNGFAAWRAAMD
jgi:cystathionine beta-lyase